MPLLRCEKIRLAFGAEPLLDGIDLQIRKGDRLCLVGRNGSGKSTLLRIISGELQPDDGNLWRRDGLKVATLDQNLPSTPNLSVYEAVAEGMADLGLKLARYHHLNHQLSQESANESKGIAQELAKLQNEIDAADGWALNRKIDAVLSRMNLSAELLMRNLSGGWLRRVALAKTLVQEPDLLLLDEPTNHMDIPMIQWLEDHLLDFKGAVLFVTHDRTLISRLATAIADLDRGRLTVWQEDYQTYLRHRDQRREVEDRQNTGFDKKLAQEERWIRQGIKARRTRNEGRVRALQALRKERSQRRALQGRVTMQIDGSERSGKLVKELINVSHSYGDRTLIKNLDFILMRGDRVGIIGANGSGKSTLLRIILGEIHPDEGQVRSGTRLDVAYYDQLREQLDMEKTVAENISQGKDFVTINNRNIHVITYLGNFLFPAERARVPVKVLSGGETNRLLLAKLFSRPSNLLVLDEPTNDLDVETLELLEELLMEFKGTVLLVTHDRAFLDNVVTSTLVFEDGVRSDSDQRSREQGTVKEFVGGYEDWVNLGGGFEASRSNTAPGNKPGDSRQHSGGHTRPAGRKQDWQARQSQKKSDRRLVKEFESLPDKLEQLEQQLEDLHSKMGKPGFYGGDTDEQEKVIKEAESIEQELAQSYARWEELESKLRSIPE
jgi:ATP-binding cassette subfamily F protein uup